MTQNDYQLRLFNGDVGIIAAASDEGPTRRHAVFVAPDGSERRLSPARLPPHETVFAMSVHKSQGSEFDAVAVLLPPEPSPVVSRELLYTAVTRARRRATISVRARWSSRRPSRHRPRFGPARRALGKTPDLSSKKTNRGLRRKERITRMSSVEGQVRDPRNPSPIRVIRG